MKMAMLGGASVTPLQLLATAIPGPVAGFHSVRSASHPLAYGQGITVSDVPTSGFCIADGNVAAVPLSSETTSRPSPAGVSNAPLPIPSLGPMAFQQAKVRPSQTFNNTCSAALVALPSPVVFGQPTLSTSVPKPPTLNSFNGSGGLIQTDAQHAVIWPQPAATALSVSSPAALASLSMANSLPSHTLPSMQSLNGTTVPVPLVAPFIPENQQSVASTATPSTVESLHAMTSSQAFKCLQGSTLVAEPSPQLVDQSATGTGVAGASGQSHTAILSDYVGHVPIVVNSRLFESLESGQPEVSVLERCIGIPGGELVFDSGPSGYSRSICLLECPYAFGVVRGTGWLLDFDGRTAIITNHHILESKECAEASVAIFDFEKQGIMMGVYDLDTSIFVTNKQLDYTIVGVHEVSDRKPLKISMPEPCVGDRVTVVGHPNARHRQLSTRRVVRISNKMIFYDADTETGSSGSPVLRWDEGDYAVVALHRGYDGVSRKNYGVLITEVLADARDKASHQTEMCSVPTKDD